MQSGAWRVRVGTLGTRFAPAVAAACYDDELSPLCSEVRDWRRQPHPVDPIEPAFGQG